MTFTTLCLCPASGAFVGLRSLAALNLERNLLQKVGRETFQGVNDTLSSLSLLNNLIADYPGEAINYLTELRVSTYLARRCYDVPKHIS